MGVFLTQRTLPLVPFKKNTINTFFFLNLNLFPFLIPFTVLANTATFDLPPPTQRNQTFLFAWI